MKLTSLPSWVCAAALGLAALAAGAAPRPNILIIMPDDLSYDDFSRFNASGPRTPNIDRLGRESVRLTDYHVSPTCSPSRAALMTGRYNDATGVWHTIMGRELLRSDEVTMPQVFRTNGYQTALVGKWHLGDFFPLRASDRGFAYTAMIYGGGADQQPDYWGDTNVPPSTYFVQDKPVALTASHDGIIGAFSTNFFTDHAIGYLRRTAAADTPFFLYLAYNVAHVPHDMPPDARPGITAFTATIENLDKNVGRVLAYLQESRLADNTIVIFFTDNGEASDGLRGGKASQYEGGHRVPCFIRWPAGGMGGSEAASREVPLLTSHIDWLPTLMELAHLHDVADRPTLVPLQGHSIASLLSSDASRQDRSLWNRTLVVDNQRREQLLKYREACVMRDETDTNGRVVHQWRLIIETAGKPWELYDLESDRKETIDLVDRPGQADRVASLKAAYEAWWTEIDARGQEYTRYILGSAVQPRVCLYSHDWHGNFEAPTLPPWNDGMIAAGLKVNGFSAVQFSRAGTWRFELRRWPEEIGHTTSLGSTLPQPVAHPFRQENPIGVALPIRSARVRVWNGKTTYVDRKEPVDPASSAAVFTASVPAGPAFVQTWFYGPAGEKLGGAYYDYVEFVSP